jgi:hypothetical protein
MKPKDYSTAEAAKKAGIDRVTLQRWIVTRPDCPRASVEIPLSGGLTLRRWSAEDVARLKSYAREHKLENTGRPPKNKD